jgi:hypothetical protein
VTRKNRSLRENQVPGIVTNICLIGLFLVLSLTGSVVRGQQSYISFSDRPGSDSGSVFPLANSSKKKLAAPVPARDSGPSPSAVAALPPLPGQLQPGIPSPIAFNPNAGQLSSPTDSQAVQVQATASATNVAVPVQEPPLPPSPLPPGYVPGVTSVPVVPPDMFNTDEKTYEGFGSRLLKAYFGKKEQEEEAEANHRTGSRSFQFASISLY